MEEITSKNNPRIIAAQKLHTKKYRSRTGLFCFEGIKLLREAVAAGLTLTDVFVTPTALARIEQLSLDCLTLVTDEVYGKLTAESAPEGIFCVAKQPAEIPPINDSRMVICSVRDPGNIGTILRSALAFGIGQIILTDDCADLYSEKVARSAMGALFRQSVHICGDAVQQIEELKQKGYRMCAAVLSDRAVPCTTLTIDAHTCFVIGNEGHGLDQQTVRACDCEVIIPIEAQSESLNASVAASVFLWEMRRTRREE